MTRVRSDNCFGTITNNPLTNVGTTLNSAGLANLAAVSSAEALIVLDPNRVAGVPEIVVVTAHAGAATSATIQRGQFGTSAREHLLGTEWVHAPVASNATSYVTAADDQGDYVPMNAWETWTPTITQVGSVTFTNTRSRLIRIGRLIIADADMAITGAGTTNNAILVAGFPAAAATTSFGGSFRYFDTGAAEYVGIVQGSSTTAIRFHPGGVASGQLGVVPNFACANTDVFRFQVIYEAAS